MSEGGRILDSVAVEQPRTLTYADYAALPDDGRRYQLIDGELFEMAAPSTRHQDIVLRLGVTFLDHVRRTGRPVYIAPCDVVLSDTVTVQPDVVYLSAADAHRVTAPNIQGPPTLVVGSSPSPATIWSASGNSTPASPSPSTGSCNPTPTGRGLSLAGPA